jgi:Tol biopolymer transport system component
MNSIIFRLQACIMLTILLLSVHGCASTPKNGSTQKKTIYERINSDPPGASIYWGENQNRLVYTGQTTPYSKPNTKEAPIFKAWYYQVKKEGYHDSKVIFMPYSPDDRTIDFSLEPIRVPAQTPTPTANVKGIARITNDSNLEFYPQPSPDGKEILFHVIDSAKQGYNSYSIVLLRPGNGDRKVIAGNYAAYPSWYPDGKHFIYSYYKGGNPSLVKAPVNGAGKAFISPDSLGSHDQKAHVSSDGRKIAFAKMIGNKKFICSANQDGAGFTVYVEGTSPRWNKDSSIIAFTRQVGAKLHIFTLEIKTGLVTQLTVGDSNNGSPSFSPDGSWLLFSSDRDGVAHLYVMKNDGSSLMQLTKGDSQEIDPSWSSDGTIYFSSDAGAGESIEKPLEWTHSNIWRLRPVLQ